MMYLTSVPPGPSVYEHLSRPDFGLLCTPTSYRSMKSRLDHWPIWAGDNGAWSTSNDGFKPAKFIEMLEDDLLQSIRNACLFVAAPDALIVESDASLPRERRLQYAKTASDAERTLELFNEWEPVIRGAGFPVAFVAHNIDVLPNVPWDRIDTLFLGGILPNGGPDARVVAQAALAHDKYVHMGRVNSGQRMMMANDIGCHTTDGTLLSYGPDIHAPRIARWLDAIANASMQELLWE